MGSSSAFTVGLYKALLALRGETVGKKDLAQLAMELEQNRLKEHVGSQDQIATAFGGLNPHPLRSRRRFPGGAGDPVRGPVGFSPGPSDAVLHRFGPAGLKHRRPGGGQHTEQTDGDAGHSQDGG